MGYQLEKAIDNYTVLVNESKERSREVRDREDPDRKKRARRRMSGDKDASRKFPVRIDNAAEKERWKALMSEITRKYQEKVEQRKSAKKERIEAENAATEIINSLIREATKRARINEFQEGERTRECMKLVNEILKQLETQEKAEIRLQKAQRKREKREEKEKEQVDREAMAGRQQTTTRTGRVIKRTQRLNE